MAMKNGRNALGRSARPLAKQTSPIACDHMNGAVTMVAQHLVRNMLDVMLGRRQPPKLVGESLLPPPMGSRQLESVSPQKLFDLYRLLSEDEKGEFLTSVGHVSESKVLWQLLAAFDPLHVQEFSNQLFDQTTWTTFPYLIRQAVELIKERPDLADDADEFERELAERCNESMRLYNEEIGDLAELNLKRKRDRKSNPKTILRNVEICDLRKKNRKHWSLGRLAKKYTVSTRAITKVLSEEEKWRTLAAQLGTN
jgi:hypothetical protein